MHSRYQFKLAERLWWEQNFSIHIKSHSLYNNYRKITTKTKSMSSTPEAEAAKQVKLKYFIKWNQTQVMARVECFELNAYSLFIISFSGVSLVLSSLFSLVWWCCQGFSTQIDSVENEEMLFICIVTNHVILKHHLSKWIPRGKMVVSWIMGSVRVTTSMKINF